jgi:hypothetical protein
MAGKKMEGDEQQRRKQARAATRHGRLFGEERASTGASNKRHDLPREAEHRKKLCSVRQGEQAEAGVRVSNPGPIPGIGR